MDISILKQGGRLIRRSLASVNESTLVKNLKIATALLPDWPIIRSLRQHGYFYQKLDFNGYPCCVIYQGLDFNSQPSSSKNSQAIYPARLDNGVESFLLQYLPPNSVTSRHHHKITTEKFHNLEGNCVIEINGTNYELQGATLQVNPGQIHQVHTRDKPALTLIEMLGNPKGLDMDDHYYEPPLLKTV
ncbi:MAG: cupin domain-containing protein [Nanoarchaeota archaeon]